MEQTDTEKHETTQTGLKNAGLTVDSLGEMTSVLEAICEELYGRVRDEYCVESVVMMVAEMSFLFIAMIYPKEEEVGLPLERILEEAEKRRDGKESSLIIKSWNHEDFSKMLSERNRETMAAEVSDEILIEKLI